jgi:hypothetical protein
MLHYIMATGIEQCKQVELVTDEHRVFPRLSKAVNHDLSGDHLYLRDERCAVVLDRPHHKIVPQTQLW